MLQKLKNFIKQPLLHFLLIGGLFFALFKIVNPDISGKDTIVINDEDVDRITSLFEKEWSRVPTEKEMNGLINTYIQQEIYYRKALLINLDHNDELIRRRLDQKLKFLTNDLATLNEPTDLELKEYFEANKHKYLSPRKYSFSHIYFNPDKRNNARQDALTTLQTLPESVQQLNELITKGDAFPFSYSVEDLSEPEISKQMGDGFTRGLQDLPLKKWSGPLLSGYGFHLIFIEEFVDVIQPTLAQVKVDVLRDYEYNKQQQYNEQLLEQFKKDFTIVLEIKDPEKRTRLSQITSFDEIQ
jgi:PPIC-type PPIASE domain